jgi:hypothetical protein
MKRLLFLILLLANVGIYCQNTEKTNGLVSLGFFFSPNYSYRHLEYDDSMINIVEAREFYEKPALASIQVCKYFLMLPLVRDRIWISIISTNSQA